MIITFICDVLGQENNGTTIATMNLIRNMREAGHTVRLVTDDVERKDEAGVFLVPPINFGPFNGYVHHNGVNPASSKDTETIRKALEGADVVHFNFAGVLAKKAVRMAKKMNIPCVASLHTQAENFTVHVFLQHSRLINHLFYRILYGVLFSKVDAIHYPSEFIHNLFERHNHFKSNAYVISNGIKTDFTRMDVARPPELEGKIVIAFTGRYSREKTHKTLFKAMKYSKYSDRIVLLLPGAGPLENKFKNKYSKYCKNPPILGFHPHSEMIELLNCVDIYAHVSRVDIEPVSFLEAISIGLPPILTDSRLSSVSSFAVDKELNVFHHGDAKDLAEHIDYFIEHPDIAKANGEKYYGLASKYKIEDSMKKMEQMFIEVIENHKKKQGP